MSAMFSSAIKSFSSNISSNYTLSANPTSTAGPWKIFDAKKKSTGKAASVFVFDKKSLDPRSGSFGGRSGNAGLKRAHEEVLERLKKEASSLARLRHPCILELVEPVEETRNGGLMFATEQVTASLAGLLQEKDEQEQAGGVGGRRSRYVVEEADGKGRRRRELEIDELEIQKGLLQIGKGLEFLHESAGLVHGNLTPEAIFVNAKSDWKISGLGFSSPPDNSTKATSVTPISLSEVLNYDSRLPRPVQLNLDYTSPDFVMDTNLNTMADMFSLGLLVIALYNSPHSSPLEAHGSASTYKKLFASSSSIPTANNNFLSASPLPKELVSGVLPRLITRRPAQRMSAREFQEAPYFDNMLVSAIRFLDSLPAKTANEKSQFMRGLPRIMSQFPKSVLEKKVLPALLEEMKDRELLSVILQNAFKIIGLMPSGRRTFAERVIPKLREVYLTGTNTKGPGQDRDSLKEAGLMVVLENMNMVAEHSTGKEFKDEILPILQLALDSSTHYVVDASLRTLPVVLPVLDFTTVKNDLFPVIAQVFSKTSSMGIKIRGLEALQTICGGTPSQDSNPSDGLDGISPSEQTRAKASSNCVLDKYTVQEKVVPLLKAIKTKEPAVMMASLEVFKQVGKVADADFIALEVLPILWNFSLGPLLNISQFQGFMALIKSLSTRVETEQGRKLQDLATNAPSANGADDFMNFGGQSRTDNADDVDFESLVLGRKTASSPNMLDSGWGQSTSTSGRPPALRANSNRSTAEAPAFSWSSPSTTAPPSRAGYGTSSSSRAITPDPYPSAFSSLNTNSFSSSTPSFGQPLQPTPSGMNVLSPTQSPWSANQSSQSVTPSSAGTRPMGGSSVNWTAAAAASEASNPWSNSNSTSAFGQPPAISPLGQQTTSFTASQPASSSFSSFSIAPPPAQPTRQQSGYRGGGGPGSGMGMGMGAGTSNTTQQQQQSQKQGMEKYDSLI